jgi:hypothetical protein
MELKKRKRRYLQIALVLIGFVFLLLYPLMQLWPSGWVWLPRQHEYEQMMIGVTVLIALFLLWVLQLATSYPTTSQLL